MVKKRIALFAFLAFLLGFQSCSSSRPSDAQSAQFLYDAGLSYFQDEKYPDAIAILSEEIRVDSIRTGVSMLLSLSYLRLEFYDLAQQEIKRTCELKGNFPEC